MALSPINTSNQKRARPEDLEQNHYTLAGGRRIWVRTDEHTLEAMEHFEDCVPTWPSPRSATRHVDINYYDRCPIPTVHPSLTLPQDTAPAYDPRRMSSATSLSPPPPPLPSAPTHESRPARPRPQDFRPSSGIRQHSAPPLQRRPAPAMQIEKSCRGRPPFPAQKPMYEGPNTLNEERPVPPEDIPMPPDWLVKRLMQRGDPFPQYRAPPVPGRRLHGTRDQCLSYADEERQHAPQYTARWTRAKLKDAHPRSRNTSRRNCASPVEHDEAYGTKDVENIPPRRASVAEEEDDDGYVPRWEALSGESRALSLETGKWNTHRTMSTRCLNQMPVVPTSEYRDELAFEAQSEQADATSARLGREIESKRLEPQHEALITFRLE
ncbi:uncharacterized protein PHACADRAFT_260853 [Phanerochaete carnosa HHB-10118-sp]|uniref:Uncharacterized protein n=1 Tax=Phanerochaete carnosa (strain HHB-10118-sp) TaxID=650164 RepID=K5W0Q4_PHACS|nr:uncharacterized protein PHACADRAFT_260853 [Phanerochaete carnosa HHB-10118-sp]EKM52454.1 hypothetical protein PHACADRAFT_260853 [Phanerochaete carnosa HHB-10118-sp]